MIHGVYPESYTLEEAVSACTWLPQMAAHVIMSLTLHGDTQTSVSEVVPCLIITDAFTCKCRSLG